MASGLAAKKKKPKKNKKGKQRRPQHLGLLAGTVFTPDTRSAPGVKVTAVDTEDESVKLEAVTDYRGEFAIRAPASEDPAVGKTYRLTTEAKGFAPVEKTAEVYLAQKTNVNLILEKP